MRPVVGVHDCGGDAPILVHVVVARVHVGEGLQAGAEPLQRLPHAHHGEPVEEDAVVVDAVDVRGVLHRLPQALDVVVQPAARGPALADRGVRAVGRLELVEPRGLVRRHELLLQPRTPAAGRARAVACAAFRARVDLVPQLPQRPDLGRVVAELPHRVVELDAHPKPVGGRCVVCEQRDRLGDEGVVDEGVDHGVDALAAATGRRASASAGARQTATRKRGAWCVVWSKLCGVAKHASDTQAHARCARARLLVRMGTHVCVCVCVCVRVCVCACACVPRARARVCVCLLAAMAWARHTPWCQQQNPCWGAPRLPW